jgi:hypothetical protein
MPIHNIPDSPSLGRVTSLIVFAACEGWHLHRLEDGKLELQKPAMPPIHIGATFCIAAPRHPEGKPS